LSYTSGAGQRDLELSYLATQIDCALAVKAFNLQAIQQGKRRYIGSEASQKDKCLEWAENIRDPLKSLPLDKPLSCPLVDTGYATYLMERLEQHGRNNNSNYLMNLTDSICKVKFQRFRIVQFVVFHIVHLTHAMYAEIIASRVGLAYTTVGGG
jgi:hypothetical protein